MFDRKTNAGLCVIGIISIQMILMLGPLICHIDQNKQDKYAYFTLASWDHPDEYGQGIYAVTIYQQLNNFWWNMHNVYWTNVTDTFQINETGYIQLQIRGWINNTVVGAASLEDGENYLRYNVSVWSNTGELLVFQPNGSFPWSQAYAGGTMFTYYYNTTLAFSPVGGQGYKVIITSEICMPNIDGEPSIVDDTMYFLGSNGWQHDCSTDANITNVETGKVTLSSDGDVLRVTNTYVDSPKAVSFWINHSSQETIETDDFPFLSINITAMQGGAEWELWLYDNSTLTKIYGPSSETGIFSVNIKAGYGSDPNQIYFYAGGITGNNKWIDVSWVKVYSAHEWAQISSIKFAFWVPIPESAFWNLNVILIFAGLIMMPVSTLYLVRGGRKDLDSDKVFYAIVAFVMGWALVLGGIMP